MTTSLKTVIYPVKDLAAAKTMYSRQPDPGKISSRQTQGKSSELRQDPHDGSSSRT